MIKILVVDDHLMFIDGIKSLLRDEEGIKVIGEASNGGDAVHFVRNHQPHIVLMDLKMPGLDGLEATRIIKDEWPHVKIIMLTMHLAPDTVSTILDAGASGYILKNTGRDELVIAIMQVAAGKTYYSNEVTDALLYSYKIRAAEPEAVAIDDVELTDREKEVLRLISQEFTTYEIAEKLKLSAHTIETYRKNLQSKLGTRNIAGLVKYAVKNGYE